MFGKKTAEDLLKMLEALSDDEKAKFMEQIGVAEETVAEDDKGETPEKVTEEKTETEEEIKEEVEEKEDGEEIKEEVEEKVETKTDDENLEKFGARLDAFEAEIKERLSALESFMEAIKDEDTKEKGDLGYQKAEEAKANARKTYAEIRKEVIGV